MQADEQRTTLLVVRHSPYGSSLARAAVDIALAAGAFEQALELLFLGDGVLQLMPNQDGHALGTKDIGRQLAALPLYDIEKVYVEADAAARYALDIDNAPLPVKTLASAELSEFLSRFDHILSL